MQLLLVSRVPRFCGAFFPDKTRASKILAGGGGWRGKVAAWRKSSMAWGAGDGRPDGGRTPPGDGRHRVGGDLLPPSSSADGGPPPGAPSNPPPAPGYPPHPRRRKGRTPPRVAAGGKTAPARGPRWGGGRPPAPAPAPLRLHQPRAADSSRACPPWGSPPVLYVLQARSAPPPPLVLAPGPPSRRHAPLPVGSGGPRAISVSPSGPRRPSPLGSGASAGADPPGGLDAPGALGRGPKRGPPPPRVVRRGAVLSPRRGGGPCAPRAVSAPNWTVTDAPRRGRPPGGTSRGVPFLMAASPSPRPVAPGPARWWGGPRGAAGRGGVDAVGAGKPPPGSSRRSPGPGGSGGGARAEGVDGRRRGQPRRAPPGCPSDRGDVHRAAGGGRPGGDGGPPRGPRLMEFAVGGGPSTGQRSARPGVPRRRSGAPERGQAASGGKVRGGKGRPHRRLADDEEQGGPFTPLSLSPAMLVDVGDGGGVRAAREVGGEGAPRLEGPPGRWGARGPRRCGTWARSPPPAPVNSPPWSSSPIVVRHRRGLCSSSWTPNSAGFFIISYPAPIYPKILGPGLPKKKFKGFGGL